MAIHLKAVGRPTALAAYPRARQRTSPPSPLAWRRVAPSYSALLRVEFAAFHSAVRPESRSAASSLWHWSSSHDGRALPATLRWGARTFLTPRSGGPDRNARPSGLLADAGKSTPLLVGHGATRRMSPARRYRVRFWWEQSNRRSVGDNEVPRPRDVNQRETAPARMPAGSSSLARRATRSRPRTPATNGGARMADRNGSARPAGPSGTGRRVTDRTAKPASGRSRTRSARAPPASARAPTTTP
jgi:hypothetical protein